MNELKQKQFNSYLQSQNKLFNLTAIKDEDKSWKLNILDSLLFLHLFDESGDWCDIGSGSGCPAIPIKIERPNLNLTMIDSVGKKVNFLNNAAKLLELKNTEAHHSRIEDVTNKFEIVSARAVAPLPTLLEYAIPMLKLGGVLIAFKGSNYLEELNISQNAIKILGCKLEKTEIKEFEDMQRVCLVFKKIKETPKGYPRKNNAPRLKPL